MRKGLCLKSFSTIGCTSKTAPRGVGITCVVSGGMMWCGVLMWCGGWCNGWCGGWCGVAVGEVGGVVVGEVGGVVDDY